MLRLQIEDQVLHLELGQIDTRQGPFGEDGTAGTEESVLPFGEAVPAKQAAAFVAGPFARQQAKFHVTLFTGHAAMLTQSRSNGGTYFLSSNNGQCTKNSIGRNSHRLQS